ncbi:MAG: hypothetical protein CMC86_03325 [Flavobacteriaceae bacterium]|nr:hypothetical protein [Flavobacteriaceae bacterium]
MEYASLIVASIISGLILFQSILIAPSINKVLKKKEASTFLRYIWPKFFLLIGILSLVSFMFEFFKNSNTSVALLSISGFIFMIVCFLVTPTINKAKDNSKKQLWVVLHLSTVVITFIVLTINIFIICNKL